jgi:hypothetical protein
MAGAATGTFFRRGEGMFLRSHYLAAEIASLVVQCTAFSYPVDVSHRGRVPARPMMSPWVHSAA